MKSEKKSTLIISILIPLAIGAFSALLSGNIPSDYAAFVKPSFAPPSIVFPIVWTILYILMGISAYLIYTSESPAKTNALKVYTIQLTLNFFWSILFFDFSAYLAAFLWLLVMIAFIIIMIYLFYHISPLAAYLQLQYLLWCVFAAVLNFTVYLLN